MVKEEEEEKKTKVPQGVKKDETPKISDAFKKMSGSARKETVRLRQKAP